jgi:hypothetical protein
MGSINQERKKLQIENPPSKNSQLENKKVKKKICPIYYAQKIKRENSQSNRSVQG